MRRIARVGAPAVSRRGSPPREKGFHDVTAMETDPDLALLREEKGYRAIVADLKGRPTS
jgi:hypothetical protein